MQKALRIRLIGIVQGVGFRSFVYRLATASGISGYVRNMGGSEVEIIAEGDESA
jgi:hydrogenase maturation protein HypF